MALSVCCVTPTPSPLPSDLKRETQAGLIFSLVLFKCMLTDYYPLMILSYAHNLLTIKQCFLYQPTLTSVLTACMFAGDNACNSLCLDEINSELSNIVEIGEVLGHLCSHM